MRKLMDLWYKLVDKKKYKERMEFRIMRAKMKIAEQYEKKLKKS